MGVFLACRIWFSYSFLTKMMFSTTSSFLPHFYLLFAVFTEKHYFPSYIGCSGLNKSSYVHKGPFKLRQVLVSGGDAEQKESTATKPETLGTAFLQRPCVWGKVFPLAYDTVQTAIGTHGMHHRHLIRCQKFHLVPNMSTTLGSRMRSRNISLCLPCSPTSRQRLPSPILVTKPILNLVFCFRSVSTTCHTTHHTPHTTHDIELLLAVFSQGLFSLRPAVGPTMQYARRWHTTKRIRKSHKKNRHSETRHTTQQPGKGCLVCVSFDYATIGQIQYPGRWGRGTRGGHPH